MNNKFAIRIDDRQEYIEKLKTICQSDRFDSVLCVKHFGKTGENIHYHLCVSTDYKQQALRKEFKRTFDKGSGNGHMSIKHWDGDKKALSYMFHEDEHEIIYNTYTNEELDEFKKTNDEYKETLKKNAPNNIVAEVCLRLRKSNRFSNTTETIAFTIWDILKEKGDWFPNKFQLQRWIYRVQGELCETEMSWQRTKQDWFREMFGS